MTHGAQEKEREGSGPVGIKLCRERRSKKGIKWGPQRTKREKKTTKGGVISWNNGGGQVPNWVGQSPMECGGRKEKKKKVQKNPLRSNRKAHKKKNIRLVKGGGFTTSAINKKDVFGKGRGKKTGLGAKKPNRKTQLVGALWGRKNTLCGGEKSS